MKLETGNRRDVLWDQFLTSIRERFGPKGIELTFDAMTDEEVERAYWDLAKELYEAGELQGPIEPSLITEFHLPCKTWEEYIARMGGPPKNWIRPQGH
jgi:hypothetical protein